MAQNQHLHVLHSHLPQNFTNPAALLVSFNLMRGVRRCSGVRITAVHLLFIVRPAPAVADAVVSQARCHAVKPPGNIFILPGGTFPQPPECFSGEVVCFIWVSGQSEEDAVDLWVVLIKDRFESLLIQDLPGEKIRVVHVNNFTPWHSPGGQRPSAWLIHTINTTGVTFVTGSNESTDYV